MKRIRQYIILIVSLGLLLLLFTKWNFDNSEAFISILTFLSIISGFSITALSIIATSEFSRELYAKESKKNNSLTLLHELVSLFKNSTFLFISTIILILFYQFLPTMEKKLFTLNGYDISIEVIMKAFIWYLTIISFSAFIYLLLLFSKFVIRSVSKKK